MNVGLEEAKRWQFVCVCTCVCVRGHDISHTGSLAHVSPSDSDTHAEIDKLTHTHSRRRRLGYSALHQTLNISDRLKSPRSAESLLFSPRLSCASHIFCFPFHRADSLDFFHLCQVFDNSAFGIVNNFRKMSVFCFKADLKTSLMIHSVLTMPVTFYRKLTLDLSLTIQSKPF